ncbi:MAG: carbohydrate porin [Candidatus Brocadiaceae bacterium]|nr:carbohydrate porin [Candidatus Brocadiaceae bacterium]
MKSAYCLLRLFLIIFFFNSTFAKLADVGFGKYVYADDSESVNDFLDKSHSSGIYEPRFFEHEHLLDFRPRDILEGKGLSLEMIFTGDFVTNHSGGLKTNSDVDTHISYLSNTDLLVDVDTEKAGFWNGGIFHGHFFNHHGANPSEDYIGDLQFVDNIESEEKTKVYELWYEHTFGLYGTDLSVLVGQHDLNSEFNITEYGLLFLQSSFGFNNEISNNIPVSNFPVAALGLRIKWEPTESIYLMAEISDGDPGKNDCGLHWTLDSKEGFLSFYELGYNFGDKEDSQTMPGTYKFGWWYHTDEFDDVRDMDASGNPLEHSGNYGVYFIADQMLLPGKGEKGLGAFFQVGWVPEDRNQVDFYIGGGIHYRGLIPSRDDDVFGLAFAHASISDDLRDVEKMDRHETAIEATYKAQVFPFLTVQPGVQVIFNPGADPSLDNALVSILRVQINF